MRTCPALAPGQLHHVWPPAGGAVVPGVVPHVALTTWPATASGSQEDRPGLALLVLQEGEFVEPGARLVPARELPARLRELDLDEATVVDVPRGVLASVLALPDELGLLVSELVLPAGERGLLVLGNRTCQTPGRYLAALVSLEEHEPAVLWPEVLPTGLAASPRVRLLALRAWEFQVDPAACSIGALAIRAERGLTTARHEAQARALGRGLTEARTELLAALAGQRQASAERRHDRRFAEARGLARPEDALRLPTVSGRRADPTGLGHLTKENGPAALQRARAIAATLGATVGQQETSGRALHGIMPDLPADPVAAATALERSFSFLVPALPPEADR